MKNMATAKKPNEAQSDDLVIQRTFDAPRALMWKAWTDPVALAQWWGPKGAEIRVAKHDMRPGGVFHYAMVFARPEMWGRFATARSCNPSGSCSSTRSRILRAGSPGRPTRSSASTGLSRS